MRIFLALKMIIIFTRIYEMKYIFFIKEKCMEKGKLIIANVINIYTLQQ